MSVDRELAAIEETAAEWMVERDRGLSSVRERELARWLRADSRHAMAFNALAETWNLLGDVRATTSVNEDSLHRRQRRAWLPITLAAAAAVAVAYMGWWQPSRSDSVDSRNPFALTSATEIGVVRSIDLPDGSVIQLNTDSAVDVRYTAGERRVNLARGEAHFTVAKNRDRPFVVSVAGVDVRVVGTIFNVRLRSEAVDVLVTEGKVRVDSGTVIASRPVAEPPERLHSELTAGQKLSIDLSPAMAVAPARAELSPAKIKQVLAWQTRRLEFDATPLLDIVAEINRYNRHRLVITDSRLNAQRFGGSFPAGDHETFVRMLEASFGVIAERDVEETRLRLKKVP